MKPTKLPKGWDERRVREVLDHYENQTEEEAVAEAEAAFADSASTVMVVPRELVPTVERLVAQYLAEHPGPGKIKPSPKKRKRA